MGCGSGVSVLTVTVPLVAVMMSVFCETERSWLSWACRVHNGKFTHRIRGERCAFIFPRVTGVLVPDNVTLLNDPDPFALKLESSCFEGRRATRSSVTSM